MIRELVERLITVASRDGHRTFFDPGSFPWTHSVESDWMKARAELETLLIDIKQIPNFQDISEHQKILTTGEQWKTYFFYAFGHKAEKNCNRCPETTKLLARIPGMTTAMFSILAPGKHVPEHRGYYKGVLRYHLGLIVPSPSALCRIRVGPDFRSWEEGQSMIFDDTHPHEVWNDSASYRAILFADFIRPLPFPISILNRMMIWAFSRKRYVTESIERVRHPELLELTRAAEAIEKENRKSDQDQVR